MQLTVGDQAILDGRHGTAAAMAMRIVLGTARMLGASDLVSMRRRTSTAASTTATAVGRHGPACICRRTASPPY